MRRHPIAPALVVACGCALAVGAAAADGTTRYVTDSLRLEARTGPGVDHRILEMLDTGTPLTVLDSSDGWSHVRLPDGEEGWILDRFLMDQPPARARLADAESALHAARAKISELESTVADLRASEGKLRSDRDALDQRDRKLAGELADVRRTAASTLEIRDRNHDLESRAADLSHRLSASEAARAALRERRRHVWFLSGAGVLLGGMLLGLVIPRIRWRRRRRWGEL